MQRPADGQITEEQRRRADEERRLRRRRLSKLLLGNADRLDVAAAVARSSAGVVHAQELGRALDLTPSRVRAQLLAMVDAGVLTLPPRVGRTVDYEREEAPFWDAIRLLDKAWD